MRKYKTAPQRSQGVALETTQRRDQNRKEKKVRAITMLLSQDFDHILLRTKLNKTSWVIVAYRTNNSFQILAVLDAPITLELAREITILIATEFGIVDVREDSVARPLE